MTDEELVAIEGLVIGNATTLRQLVAEVRRLGVEVDYYKPLGQQFLERIPEFGKCLKEVEQLRADNQELERMYEAAERLCVRCGAELEAKAVAR